VEPLDQRRFGILGSVAEQTKQLRRRITPALNVPGHGIGSVGIGSVRTAA
jgi:hypothetical protein